VGDFGVGDAGRERSRAEGVYGDSIAGGAGTGNPVAMCCGPEWWERAKRRPALGMQA
jgi:hypothetical protein